MAVIENASSPEAVAAWESSLQTMSPGEVLSQQLVQRGAEHALMQLQELGVTPENCRAMLDSLRHGLVVIHEVAHARGIQLVGYDQ
jgi:hypothetical protein